MAKKTKRTGKKSKAQTTDALFILKLVMYVVLGSLWIKVTKGDTLRLPFPVGFLIGGFLALHDHFQIDRKIEIAVLFVAMLIGYLAPFGLFIGIR